MIIKQKVAYIITYYVYRDKKNMIMKQKVASCITIPSANHTHYYQSV